MVSIHFATITVKRTVMRHGETGEVVELTIEAVGIFVVAKGLEGLDVGLAETGDNVFEALGLLEGLYVGLLIGRCVGGFVGTMDGLARGLPDGRTLGRFDNFDVGFLLLVSKRVGDALGDRGTFVSFLDGLTVGLPATGTSVGEPLGLFEGLLL